MKILFQGDSVTDAGRDRSDPHDMGNGYPRFASAMIQDSFPDAEGLGVTNGEVVKVLVKSERTTIFDDVVVRVSPSYALAMHIDTDECNAAAAFGEIYGEIVRD